MTLKMAHLEDFALMYAYEQRLLDAGFRYIAGVDEVGRGPLAGPVVACAVILKPGVFIAVDDSKKLTKAKRKKLIPIIKENSLSISISFVSHDEIDRINILRASREAMIKAIQTLKVKPDYILVDGMDLKELTEIPSLGIIKGDQLSMSIAAASIIAKETRDDYMELMDTYYPMYGFKNHMGYPTKEHIEAIKKYGICNIHRKTFNPIKKMIENLEI